MISLAVTESSQVAEARRAAATLARRLGFNETAQAKVALVATELATNLAKHATGGQLLIKDLVREGSSSIELLALDKEPGISDVAKCAQDGYSTTSSPGTGLGAIFRTASLAEIYSLPGRGTAVLARIQADLPHSPCHVPSRPTSVPAFSPQHAAPGTLHVGSVCLPKPGEEACGDAWIVEQQPGRCLLMVVDGLGHGPQAAQAAHEAIRIFRARSNHGPAEVVTAAHDALRATRGAAVAVAEIDQTKLRVQFCGVGNIGGTLLTAGGSRNMVSHNGIVGYDARKIQEFTYPWTPETLLLMYSDGLGSHWSMEAYRGLQARHPSLIAGVLYRDFNRGRDDVTVVVAKQSRGLGTER
jgi:anti-sigma regulatory factor (Ser/Thr protein kinase)